jgi:hypothetical protein
MCNLNLHGVFTNIASCMSDQTKLVWVLELCMDSYDHTWYLGELDWFPYWILCKCDNFSCLMRNFNWTSGLLQEVQKKVLCRCCLVASFPSHPALLSTHILVIVNLCISEVSCVYTSSFYRKVTDIQTYRLDTDIRKAYSAQSTLAIFRNRMSVSVCMSVCL